VTKSPITDRMAELLAMLLETHHVCIISGGWLPQFEKQVVSNLHVEHHLLKNLHLMPTCGTRYYHYDDVKHAWKLVYAEDIPTEDRKRIIGVLIRAAKETGHLELNPYGELAQDRYSQITFSALGQDAP